jgi:hypothetical protein
MTSQNDLTAGIQRELAAHDELRRRSIDVPGAHEVGEVLQGGLDIELNEHREVHSDEYADQGAMWEGFRTELNGRHLNDAVITGLMQLADRYTIYEVAALVSRFKALGISVNVTANRQSEVTMAWQADGA